MFNYEPGFRKESHFSHHGVLRHYSGRLLVCEIPLCCALPVVDTQRMITRTRDMAQVYAQGIMHNLHLREIYKSVAMPRISGYLQAIRDYFNPPEILGVQMRRYSGRPGQKIRIKAQDDVMVTAVEVCIYDGGGRLLEGGRAVINSRKPVWEYTARERNPMLRGSRVVIYVSDIPGNVASKVIIL